MGARKQYLLRVDPDLWAAIERWAADNLRSVNGQVEYILREAVRQQRKGSRATKAPSEDAGDNKTRSKPIPPD